jgi:4-diphosphocytidyl-2-C-methyl-D-erythritol kinase
MTLTTLCPAKINRFLSVGPPDGKGWHPLRTVFQAISLSDRLEVDFGSPSPGLQCSWPDLPAGNTLTKTLSLAQEAIQLPPLAIRLTKAIPAQSGLGGGSSDAAGLIRVLARWMPEAFPSYFQKEIAMSVGADVPFFLVGGRAKGEGYGEILTSLPDHPRRWLVIAQPEKGRSTPEAFRDLDAAPREWADWPDDETALYNDFERVAGCGSLELIEILLSLGCTQAGLTGSGSAVFGLTNSQADAESICSRLPEGLATFRTTCHTLSRQESLWMS